MNKKLSTQKIIAIITAFIAIVLLALSAYGYKAREASDAKTMLDSMLVRALLVNTGEGAAEVMVKLAVEEARIKSKAEGLSMSERRAVAEKVEKETRASLNFEKADYSKVNNGPINQAALNLKEAQIAYNNKRIEELELYQEKQKELSLNDQNIDIQPLEVESEVVEDLQIIQIDTDGFVQSEECDALALEVDNKYQLLCNELLKVYPQLDATTMETLKSTLLNLNYTPNETFEARFNRLIKYNVGNLGFKQHIMNQSKGFLLIGIFLIILACIIWFYNALVKKIGVPRIIIGAFFIVLCLGALALNLNLKTLLSDTIVRMGMNSILVLAMVPGIQSGIRLNLGLPLGIIGGLLGGLLCIELGYVGWGGFVFALVVGIAIALVLGYFYALLLNKLKGSEMAVTTYVGFSIVSLMCIGWLLLPFNSPVMKWPLGNGLRTTINMDASYKHILNNFLSFKLFGITIPTGLVLFMLIMCLILWLFSRSRTGIAMQAVGNNSRFAEATGINVDKMRIIGTILSTVLGAIGIIVYTQSYGFMQLYTAPRQMGFVAASAILIGGASTSRAKISHVLIGTFLFQGILTLGMPVANQIVPQSTISETMRILISNGIILYALTKAGDN